MLTLLACLAAPWMICGLLVGNGTVEFQEYPRTYVPYKNGIQVDPVLSIMGKRFGNETLLFCVWEDGTVVWDRDFPIWKASSKNSDFESDPDGYFMQVMYEAAITTTTITALKTEYQLNELWQQQMDGSQNSSGGRFVHSLHYSALEGLLILQSNHVEIEREPGRVLMESGPLDIVRDPLDFVLEHGSEEYIAFRLAWNAIAAFAFDVVALAESTAFTPPTSTFHVEVRE